jgi:GNAT superfamily N-acetyltransferase
VIIREMQPEDLGAVLTFIERIFPERRDVRVQFKHQFQGNPFLRDFENPRAVLAFDGDDVVGQMLLNPCEYLVGGKASLCYFASDFYVMERYRTLGIGGLIAAEAVRRFRPFFTIGVAEMAKPIMLALGVKTIGKLHKYAWFRRSPKTVISILRHFGGMAPTPLRKLPFPKLLSTSEGDFRRDMTPESGNQAKTDNRLLSFTRSPEFIRWRFLDHPNGYSIFTLECAPSTFFVVRMHLYRDLHFLGLVDCVYPCNRTDSLTQILDCTKRLAKAVRADGVLTMSSCAQEDQQLRSSGFLRLGNASLIMSNAPDIPDRDRIAAREAVAATMADSDVEFGFPSGSLPV